MSATKEKAKMIFIDKISFNKTIELKDLVKEPKVDRKLDLR